MSADTDENSETLSVELDRALLHALDAYAAAGANRASRSGAARRILHDWLRSNGYLRLSGEEEGIRPEDLSSANDG